MKTKEILSGENPTYRTLKSLLHAKGIKKENRILVSGKKIAPELLARSAQNQTSCRIEQLIFCESLAEEAASLVKIHPIPHAIKLGKNLFNMLDDSGTNYPLLVLETPAFGAYQASQKGLNVFLALSDPSNLGAALRSLKAFDCTQVVLLKESANVFLPKVTKTASGLNLSLPISYGPSISELEINAPICLDMSGEELTSFRWPEISNLILGEEGKGVPAELKKRSTLLRIGMNPEVESLSAPIAISIAAHAWRHR